MEFQSFRGRGRAEAGDVVPNNEPLKIKWSSKASEVENEAIGEDLHVDVKTT